ncbi:hypothetical protein EAF63_24415, partial [Escherichia coli]|nr:hypothetical protein [Escherichia coli]EFO1064964.1 hypothetical protein [Escherichia coli]
FRIVCQYRLSCIHLKCPFTVKMDISIGNRKGRRKTGLNETVTHNSGFRNFTCHNRAPVRKQS